MVVRDLLELVVPTLIELLHEQLLWPQCRCWLMQKQLSYVRTPVQVTNSFARSAECGEGLDDTFYVFFAWES